MKIAEICDRCGAERPAWLGDRHRCHADFVRHTWRKGAGGWEDRSEPHTAEEFFRGWQITGSLVHSYPPEPDVA